MMRLTYSAGLISQSFWFIEFKKIIKLIHEGKTEEEIRALCLDENLFGAAKEYRAKRMYGYIINRAKVMDRQMIDLFVTSDLATQKIINLICILKSDRLFCEFLYDVYREKIILGLPTIDRKDVSIFLDNKMLQSEEIINWSASTLSRLSSIYLNYLTDANLITVIGKLRTVTPPILDVALERYLLASGDEIIVKAITGAN
jgi:hypothetical protein